MNFLSAQARIVPACSMVAWLMLTAYVATSQSSPGPPGQTSTQPSTKAPATPPPPGQPAPNQAPVPGAPAAPTPAPPPRSFPSASNSDSSPIEFQSHNLDYEGLTKNGITVMFATLPPHIKDYNIVQVTVTNASLITWTVRPSDFSFARQDGTALSPVSADEVVESLMEKASRNDVVKLQLLYEDSIYALANFRSTNGYEQRREAAMTQFVNRGFKAAAAASALILVPTKLRSGDSTDGAVFFENKTKEKNLGPGRFIAHACGETFEFFVYSELKTH